VLGYSGDQSVGARQGAPDGVLLPNGKLGWRAPNLLERMVGMDVVARWASPLASGTRSNAVDGG
jgi:hypothetical protein